MSRRNRNRRPARREPYLEPKPIILIVCEGDTTEPEYFDGLSRAFRNQLVRIKIAPEHGVPRTLVEIARGYQRDSTKQARRSKDDNLAFDSVWCVFDIDDHPDVGEAKEMARDNKISLAISNPSFELWLLLHFRGNPGMQHRDEIRRMLRDFVAGYNKHVEFAKFAVGYSQAVVRARKMHEAAEADGEAGRNPSTSVFVLTELIRGTEGI